MGIYSPMADGDVIVKWDKEFVTNIPKKYSKNRWRIKYEQLK